MELLNKQELHTNTKNHFLGRKNNNVRIDNFIEKCQSIYTVGGALVFD